MAMKPRATPRMTFSSATCPILGRLPLAKLSKSLSSVGLQPHDLLLAVCHAPEYAQPVRKSNDFTALGANKMQTILQEATRWTSTTLTPWPAG